MALNEFNILISHYCIFERCNLFPLLFFPDKKANRDNTANRDKSGQKNSCFSSTALLIYIIFRPLSNLTPNFLLFLFLNFFASPSILFPPTLTLSPPLLILSPFLSH